MRKYWWCAILFRILLPCCMAAAVFIRPTITSYIYMLMGFYMPFFSVPTARTMLLHTGNYMKMLVTTCILICCGVISFYFALFFPTGYEYEMEPCGTLERYLRTFGIIEYRDLPIKDAVAWILPEPLMLLTSVVLYVLFKKLTSDTEVERAAYEMEGLAFKTEVNRKKLLAIFLHFGKYLVVFMFCVTAVLKPSAIGVIYYVVFLVVLTYWSCNKSLGTAYARILIGLIPIIICHMSMLFIYQLQYFQDNKSIDPESAYGRLFQLIQLKTYKDCKDPRLFKFHEHSNATYVLPFSLYVLYYLCVLVSRQILQAKDGVRGLLVACFRRKPQSAMSAKWKMAFRKVQDQIEDEKLNAVEGNLLADKVKGIAETTVQFIIRISYLFANFIMMIWAIAYVGWKTLILLIGANLIWLLPARRKIMLTVSPVLVIYVWFLLGTSYLYSLDVDIPSKLGIINLASGSHWGEAYWAHLLIQSLFAVIIFITMRQFFQERAFKKQQRNLAEAVGLNTAEAATDLGPQPDKSKTLKSIYSCLQKWFTLSWIWVVVITMIWINFWSSTNPFSIVFVGLAFILIMAFQLGPFNCWKIFLWIYWWIVIIYAMFNLFLIYLYQLSLTQRLLHKYLLSEEEFKRFGFYQVSDKKSRFFLLAVPLFLQIAIVIQQNYLQKNFNRLTSPVQSDELAIQENDLEESDPRWKNIVKAFRNGKNVFFSLMELHIQKIILLIGWMLCLYDICAMFVPFVLLLIISCIFGRLFTTFTIYLMACFVQILILSRLVYMNQNLYHDKWNYIGYYERNGRTYNKTLNSADWLGFHKSSLGRNQAEFWPLAWSFLFVLAVTLERVVVIRQFNYRKRRNLPTLRQRVMYPEINYQNCHDNVTNMLKFLVNYGFFKLGVELSVVMLSIVMMKRMDFISLLLSLCLLFTYALNRKWTEIIWMPILICVAIFIPWQYVMTLGFWPTYWNRAYTRYWNENDFKIRIQQFCHLMNMAHPPNKEKITYDFLLLLCLSRQWRSFRIARKFRGREFGAGSNESVANLIDDQDVVNPVPDFVTYTRSFLDIYKKLFFYSWFYLSVLATFLAGAMRPTLYSFGYILWAFIIMWEGTEMFLRPPKSLLLRWNLLILYNVLIMVFRSISQFFGCILIYENRHAICAIYSMFSLGCVDKFGMTTHVPNMKYHLDCPIRQAALGAYLIEQQRQKKKEATDTQDALIRANINKKMDRYRANSQKIQVIRSGDYSGFDNVERNLDIPLLPPKPDYVDKEYDPYGPMNLPEYCQLFYNSDISTVLEARAFRKRLKQASLEGNQPDNVRSVMVTRTPRAGTSRAPDTMIETETSTFRKIINIFPFLWGLMESIIVSMTSVINGSTQEFRDVLDEMDKGRKLLKEKTNYTKGDRVGSMKIWKPARSYRDVLNTQKVPDSQETKMDYSIYAKLLKAIWFLLLRNSEWICYLTIIFNQVIRANFISLPLPMMVFCWGALTVPKPTKTFWVITIAYTLIMLLIKNFFVMEVADWNENLFPENSFYPPTVIGIVRSVNTFLNLALLISLFFHRVVLQQLGLWEPFIYRTVSLINDGDYNFKDGKFIPLNKNEAANKNTMNIRSIGVSIGDYFPRSVQHGAGKYAEGFRLFIQQLISPSSAQIPVDVYTPMFLCDVINLCLILFCYGYFEDQYIEDMGLLQYIEHNRVPSDFIGIFVAYCATMVIDRWIYLRRNRFAKLAYLYFQVIFIHIWFFVLYPLLTGRVFSQTIVVQIFYVSKCCYFLYSAYQIRSGYPKLISQHCLTHGTGLSNRFGFKLYTMIPYLFELRTLLDWTCTDTSLSVTDYFKMELINQSVFDQKCQQDYEDRVGEKAGIRRNRRLKYFIGGILFFILFLTIIFPFFIFSLGDTVGVRTHPAKMNLEVYMGLAEPIFRSYAAGNHLRPFTVEEYKNLTRTFNSIRDVDTILGSFEYEDVVLVKWSDHSLSSWMISPGSFTKLIEDLKSNEPFRFLVRIQFTHISGGGGRTDRIFGQTTKIPPLPDVHRQNLIDMLVNGTDKVVLLPMVFPKFMRITKDAKPRAIAILDDLGDDTSTPSSSSGTYATNEKDTFEDKADDDEDLMPDPKILRNLIIALRRENGKMWWQVREDCNAQDDNYLYYLKDLVQNSCENLVMYTFNEKVFSGTLHLVTGGGIMGLYLIYFMVIFGVIRKCIIDVDQIWIEDLPVTDRVLTKCREVYIARDMENYELEEELVAELIFIMRSREILIKLTRYFNDPYNQPYVEPGTKLR